MYMYNMYMICLYIRCVVSCPCHLLVSGDTGIRDMRQRMLENDRCNTTFKAFLIALNNF